MTKGLLLVFLSIFVAELGDKTQVGTLMFAADPNLSRIGVFLASSSALVLASLLAVLLGSQLPRFLPPGILKTLAGLGFIGIGIWMLAGPGPRSGL